jgi:hypothetical protein
MERLTLDMTAIRDIAYENRARHAQAMKLLTLAERHQVELGIPPQGTLADLGAQFGGDLAALSNLPGVVDLPQLARPSEVTFPGENLLPGYYLAGFAEGWEQVAATWKTHQGKCPGDSDRWYVESHLADGRDVLVTDDGPLRFMCKRLHHEHGLAVETESLEDCVARLL